MSSKTLEIVRKIENENPNIRKTNPGILEGLEMETRLVHLDLDDSFQFTCQQCGTCCCSGAIQISGKDITDLARYLGISTEDFNKKYLSRDFLLIGNFIDENIKVIELKKVDGACVFFDGNIKGCSVYPARPIACRSFPIWPGDKKPWLLIDKSIHDCPGIGKGSFQTVQEWFEMNDVY